MEILHLDYLFVAGEIGIAFTGFAGLVTVLAGRLAPAGVNPSLVRLSIVLFASLLFLGIFAVRGMILPAIAIRKSGRPFNPTLFYFTTTVTILSALALLASVFVPTLETASTYTVAIYVLVWVSASMLYRLFVLLASSDDI
jgi:hypothetical protein